MRKKLISYIVVYILLRFPAGLLENWVMGEVLKQMESRGVSFFILWILPLLATIGVIAIAVWVGNLFVKFKTKVAGGYQPKSTRTVVAVMSTASVIIGKTGGLKYELNTNNEKNRLLEATVPIQSVRFTKPTDKVIRRGDSLPVILECERNPWKRFRNKLLSVPKPRIIIKSFTEKGIKWDEENTGTADIFIEFYPK